MISRGQARSPDALKEILDITEDLVDRGIPGSYYDMGRHLDYGCGVEKDPDLALKYYRKAADLGNPEAQHGPSAIDDPGAQSDSLEGRSPDVPLRR